MTATNEKKTDLDSDLDKEMDEMLLQYTLDTNPDIKTGIRSDSYTDDELPQRISKSTRRKKRKGERKRIDSVFFDEDDLSVALKRSKSKNDQSSKYFRRNKTDRDIKSAKTVKLEELVVIKNPPIEKKRQSEKPVSSLKEELGEVLIRRENSSDEILYTDIPGRSKSDFNRNHYLNDNPDIVVVSDSKKKKKRSARKSSEESSNHSSKKHGKRTSDTSSVDEFGSFRSGSLRASKGKNEGINLRRSDQSLSKNSRAKLSSKHRRGSKSAMIDYNTVQSELNSYLNDKRLSVPIYYGDLEGDVESSASRQKILMVEDSLKDLSFTGSDNEQNIVYTEDNFIKATKFEKLIQKLTDENADISMNTDFLLTYHDSKSPLELLVILRKRLKELEGDSARSLRVYNLIKRWLKLNFYDWTHDTETMELVLYDIKKISTGYNMESYGNLLLTIYHKEKEKYEYIKPYDNEGWGSKVPPDPILLTKYVSVLDFSELELARQITLIESALFRNIQSYEIFSKGWMKEDKGIKAPGITLMIQHFNKMTYWVTTAVLKRETPKLRAEAIIKFLNVAQVFSVFVFILAMY
eukprot:TRINITY_DN6759_c0_g1_i2.p1 TRINITY_DN6759_c0_g1~~TRINITY_DN6759_c0_g1_i2.p1  ORF type:complete len:579 (+),score=124.54 TRINITY_DN6759_c0_g1_i2:15-1751(+)